MLEQTKQREDDFAITFAIRGGILAGETWLTSRSYTWPLASCILSNEGITLTTWCPPRFHFYIPKQSVRRLVLRDRRIASFLRVFHDVDELPAYIHFGTFSVQELRRGLEAFHYKFEVR
jgi:hypothetical protein